MKYVALEVELITPEVARAITSSVNTAYALADQVAKEYDFLGGELNNQIRPHLRNWAVEWELNRRATAHIIPFTSSFEENIRRNHRHLELRSNGYLLTVSQTHNALELPRECVFREPLI